MLNNLASVGYVNVVRLAAAMRRVVLVCMAVMTLPVLVQAAVMTGNVVVLPVVEDFPYNRSITLTLVEGAIPTQFKVTSTEISQQNLAADSAWMEGKILVIPEVWIRNVSWWAELTLLDNGRFQLSDHGRNEQSVVAPDISAGLYWQRLMGEARDVGVGADGTVWVVGADDYGDDFGVYRYAHNQWYANTGTAVRVDVDPLGRPWVINSENEIWLLDKGRWERISGAAKDIGVGADGSVWVVGDDERRGGYGIYTLGANGWLRASGSAVRIDVDGQGDPWVINDDDEIFRLKNGFWQKIPGLAKDVGIGADGSVWVIGSDKRAGGYGVYRFNGNGWDKVNGSGSQISVDANGKPWVINKAGEIYQAL